MSALQGEHSEYMHYDVHSLYGFSETKATAKLVIIIKLLEKSFIHAFEPFIKQFAITIQIIYFYYF